MKKHRSIEELAELQFTLEFGMKAAGIERFEKNNERAIQGGSSSETGWNKRIIQEVTFPMAQAISAYIDYYTKKPGKPVIALAYIRLLKPEETAYITIKTVIDKAFTGLNLENIVDCIGQNIEDQVRFSKMELHSKAYMEKIKERLKKARSKSHKHQKGAMLAGEKALINPKKDNFEPMIPWQNWGIDAQRHIGAALVDIFLNHVTFNGSPLFEKVTIPLNESRGKGLKEVTKLAPTKHIDGWIEAYKDEVSGESPAYRPCVIPPLNWSNPFDGGYHVPDVQQTLSLVKGRKSQIKRLTQEQMPLVYRAINGLQNMPWTISEDVLHVAKEIKRMSLGLAMPSPDPIEIPTCPIPDELKDIRGKELKTYLTEKEWEEFVDWRRDANMAYQSDNKRKSKYMSFHRTLRSAEVYADFENIHFVYTMDSRGRIYAKSDTINPQGDDFQKGLLKFAKGKPLGEHGMFWLAMQGAGKWGYDKVSFQERYKFIEDMTDSIRDFIADPLTNTGWAGADKPWQFLNWCFEWAKLKDFIEAGNDHRDFVSHIPCAQDGSCSGLQHYSAMLRDYVGGKAVNLVPDSKPNDIYGQVAGLTELKLRDLSLTDTTEEKDLALGLLSIKGGINRSLTKPPVMTRTYGSTQIRCLRTTSDYFIELQDKENKQAKAEKRSPVPVHPFAKTRSEGLLLKDAELLCSKVIWGALKETVTAASDGMKFIQDVVTTMAKAGSHAEYETPTGFIVEFKEMEYKTRRIKTQLLGSTRFSIAEETNKLDIHKMRTTSSPNFVHSLDASHLVLAVNAFLDAGFTGMAVIHDDFGTHACDTPALRDLLRKTFVNMYTEHDVISELLEHNEALLLMDLGLNLPPKGRLNLEDVLKSDYAFG